MGLWGAFAERYAGIELVFAKTIEKIYGQNCQNVGLLTSTDFSLLERLQRGEGCRRLCMHDAVPAARPGCGDVVGAIIDEHGRCRLEPETTLGLDIELVVEMCLESAPASTTRLGYIEQIEMVNPVDVTPTAISTVDNHASPLPRDASSPGAAEAIE